MSKILILRGIPAAGKSTFAKSWVQEDPEHRIRVCRDDLRKMLYGASSAPLGWHLEQNISAVEKAIAKTALEKGKDVVVDATNLRNKFVKQWFVLGYDVEFKDFEVSLGDAWYRNIGRTDHYVPRDVMERMFALTDNGKLRPAPEPVKPAVEKYEQDWNLPGAYIFDIDGTLAHIPEGGRSPYDYSRVHEDLVDEAVGHLLRTVEGTHHIIILSGREDDCRDETEKWLQDNGIYYDELYMRKAGDKRADATIKAEIFDQHIRHRHNVHGVVDDREQVVNMWRDMGLKVFQPERGQF